MTRVRDPYSRVYWRIVDDPKFAEVYDDDSALACWLRLLIAAEMAWPASATVPHGTRRPALAKLVDARLVDLQSGSRYRIHGLDRERSRRSDIARSNAAARWDADGMQSHPDGNANGMQPHPVGNAEVMLAEQRRAETSRDEQRRDENETSRGAPLPPSDDDHLDAWYRLTGSWPSAKVIPWLNDLADRHGADRLIPALAEEVRSDPDRKTLLSRTQTRLERESHEAEKARRQAETERADAERARIEEMPPEQRTANLARLRADLVRSGLMTAEQAATYVNGRNAA